MYLFRAQAANNATLVATGLAQQVPIYRLCWFIRYTCYGPLCEAKANPDISANHRAENFLETAMSNLLSLQLPVKIVLNKILLVYSIPTMLNMMTPASEY